MTSIINTDTKNIVVELHVPPSSKQDYHTLVALVEGNTCYIAKDKSVARNCIVLQVDGTSPHDHFVVECDFEDSRALEDPQGQGQGQGSEVGGDMIPVGGLLPSQSDDGGYHVMKVYNKNTGATMRIYMEVRACMRLRGVPGVPQLHCVGYVPTGCVSSKNYELASIFRRQGGRSPGTRKKERLSIIAKRRREQGSPLRVHRADIRNAMIICLELTRLLMTMHSKGVVARGALTLRACNILVNRYASDYSICDAELEDMSRCDMCSMSSSMFLANAERDRTAVADLTKDVLLYAAGRNDIVKNAEKDHEDLQYMMRYLIDTREPLQNVANGFVYLLSRSYGEVHDRR